MVQPLCVHPARAAAWPATCRSTAYNGSETNPARKARDFVRWVLADDDQELVETAQLLLSELVANAEAHAGGPLDVTAHRRETAVVFEVRDADPRQPVLCPADTDDEHGRGLALVNQLAAEWGSRPDPERGGKVVWVELPLQRSVDR